MSNLIKSSVRPINDRVLVSDMYFGEQKTKSGIVLTNDNGKTRGIYPRWAKVYAKGPENEDPFSVGDWVLIEHGRWTRGFSVDVDGSEHEIRMIDNDAILAYSNEKPNSVNIGQE